MRAVVLAGGKSERMGCEKALMEYDGKTMVEYSLEAVSVIPGDPLVISNNPEVSDFLKGVEVVPDCLIGRGPLGGIHAGLEYTKDDIFIVACDTPFLSKDTIDILFNSAGKSEITVYIHEGKIFPMPGFYSYSLIETIEKRLEGAGRDLSLQDLVRSCSNVNYVDIEEEVETLVGINTPEDYNRATGELTE